MVMNRPRDPLRKATLIVSPLALLDQWQQEIELKTSIKWKCLIYHGSGKVKRGEDLRTYDIVLTTFQVSTHLLCVRIQCVDSSRDPRDRR